MWPYVALKSRNWEVRNGMQVIYITIQCITYMSVLVGTLYVSLANRLNSISSRTLQSGPTLTDASRMRWGYWQKENVSLMFLKSEHKTQNLQTNLIIVLPSESSSVLSLLSASKAVALVTKALIGTKTTASGLLLLRTVTLASSCLDGRSLLGSSRSVVDNWEGSFVLIVGVNESRGDTSAVALVRIYERYKLSARDSVKLYPLRRIELRECC